MSSIKNINIRQNAMLDMSVSKQQRDFEKTWVGKRRKKIELIKQKNEFIKKYSWRIR